MYKMQERLTAFGWSQVKGSRGGRREGHVWPVCGEMSPQMQKISTSLSSDQFCLKGKKNGAELFDKCCNRSVGALISKRGDCDISSVRGNFRTRRSLSVSAYQLRFTAGRCQIRTGWKKKKKTPRGGKNKKADVMWKRFSGRRKVLH